MVSWDPETSARFAAAHNSSRPPNRDQYLTDAGRLDGGYRAYGKSVLQIALAEIGIAVLAGLFGAPEVVAIMPFVLVFAFAITVGVVSSHFIKGKPLVIVWLIAMTATLISGYSAVLRLLH